MFPSSPSHVSQPPEPHACNSSPSLSLQDGSVSKTSFFFCVPSPPGAVCAEAQLLRPFYSCSCSQAPGHWRSPGVSVPCGTISYQPCEVCSWGLQPQAEQGSPADPIHYKVAAGNLRLPERQRELGLGEGQELSREPASCPVRGQKAAQNPCVELQVPPAPPVLPSRVALL